MPRAIPYITNLDDPRQQQYAARKIRRAAEALTNALKVLLGAPEGRVVLAALFERGHLYDHGYEADARYEAFAAGRRDLAAEFRELAEEADEAGLDRLEQERRSRVKRDNEETAAARLSWTEANAADPYR